MIRTSSLLVSVFVCAWGLFWGPVVSAQETPRIMGEPIPHEQILNTERYQDCGLRKRAVNAFVSHRPAPKRSRQTASTIEVNYGPNFTPQAREAFERAVDIWESHISSPVPIQVDASYEALGAGVLAAAGPNNFYGVDASGNGKVDDIVGDALRDAIVGEDPSPQETDIIVNVNSQRDDWHFGPGDAPSGTIDFTSVALHELGHGLNYIGLFSLDQGRGEYFSDTVEGNRVVGVYDRQVLEEQGSGTLRALTNTSIYPNPSEGLGEALTSGQLFFGGAASEATAALGDGPPRPKLYAPTPFAEGSSIAHLDESAYPFETRNALMTPRINQAETNRQPGPILCGQFRDMGWPLGMGCQQYFRTLFAVSVEEDPGQSGSRTLSWREASDANIQEYVVDRRYFDGAFEEIKRVDASEVSGSSLTVENLGIGTFTFRLRWVQGDSTVISPERVRDTIAVRDVAPRISSRDAQERGTINLSWTVPPGTSSDFVYRIERREGRDGPFETVASVPQGTDAGEEERKRYTAERQTPGRYEYRVRAEDEAGNAVTSAAREVEVDFEGDVYALGPYPNPVRETASFDLTARESQSMQVEVYNTLGKRVYREEREVRPQDPTFLSIDVSQWASGVYFLRLRGEGSVGQTRKMVVAH